MPFDGALVPDMWLDLTLVLPTIVVCAKGVDLPQATRRHGNDSQHSGGRDSHRNYSVRKDVCQKQRICSIWRVLRPKLRFSERATDLVSSEGDET